MSPDDQRFRDAARAVQTAAASAVPPSTAQARRRQRRRTGVLAAAALVLVLVVAVGVSARRPADQAVSALGSGGFTNGTTDDTTTDDTTTHETRPETPDTARPTVTADPIPTDPHHVEGTYSGIDNYTYVPAGCAEQDHHLQAGVQFSDTRHGTLEEDYCGAIDAQNLWTGAGTFTLTFADDATLTGDFTDSAQLPTTGVPYTMHVTGGSGRYEGSSGTCAMTIHLEEPEIGTQLQTGTITCDVTMR